MQCCSGTIVFCIGDMLLIVYLLHRQTPPNISSPPPLLSRIIARFERWYIKRLYSPSNPHFPAEGQKRREEFRKRIQEEVDTGLGESKGDMWYVNVLATRPEAQGKGYASALMRHFADMVRDIRQSLHLRGSHCEG